MIQLGEEVQESLPGKEGLPQQFGRRDSLARGFGWPGEQVGRYTLAAVALGIGAVCSIVVASHDLQSIGDLNTRLKVDALFFALAALPFALASLPILLQRDAPRRPRRL